MGAPVNLESISAALSRQMEELASCFAERESSGLRRTPLKPMPGRGPEVGEWNSHISYLLSVQRALEGRLSPTDEQEQQDEAGGYVLPREFSRELRQQRDRGGRPFRWWR